MVKKNFSKANNPALAFISQPITCTDTENVDTTHIHEAYTEDVDTKRIRKIDTEDVDNLSKYNTSTISTEKQCKPDTKSVVNLIGREAIFENSFSRQTYYIHNDLIKIIDKLSKKRGKGGKTKVINEAIELYCNNLTKINKI